jgi:hypothetical protein
MSRPTDRHRLPPEPSAREQFRTLRDDCLPYLAVVPLLIVGWYAILFVGLVGSVAIGALIGGGLPAATTEVGRMLHLLPRS